MRKTIHVDKNGKVIGVTHGSERNPTDMNSSRLDSTYFPNNYVPKYPQEVHEETILNYAAVSPKTFQSGASNPSRVSTSEENPGRGCGEWVVPLIILIFALTGACGLWYLLGNASSILAHL